MSTLPNYCCLRSGLIAGCLALAGFTAGCYGVEFDEARPNVYYCQSDDECLDSQACWQFRCVDDVGPALALTLPEALTPFLAGTTEITVNFVPSDFTLSESNDKTEGQGKVEIFIDGESVAITDVEGAQLSLAAPLAAGGHQLAIQAIYGDGSPYANPSARAFTTFFVQDENASKPQIALFSPPEGHMHVLGEELTVEVAARNFAFVASSALCTWDDGCDPFAPGAMCTTTCDSPEQIPANEGHVHFYLLPDYPACLFAMPFNCNGDYVLAMLPGGEDVIGDETQLRGKIPVEQFQGPGTYTLSVSLQYGNHPPFPNPSFVIFDEITIEVIER